MRMEIILSKHCESLTGSLGRGFGYFIVKRKNRFCSVRSKHSVPPDGHWRFICACAELAMHKLHLADIKVTAGELDDALEEATDGRLQSPWAPRDAVVNAAKVLQLKSEVGL